MAKAAHSSLSDRKNKKNRSRPVIAVALVVLVGAGGAWLMFSESGDGLAADESIPWSTMTDDRYVSDEPVDYTPKPRRTPTKSPTRTPSETPGETPTPSETATPSEPTDEPTSVPTSSSTTVPTSDPRPTTRPTSTGRPTQSNSPRPSKTPTTPPWNDGGGMVDNEQDLFDLINSARRDKGCAALLPDSGLTQSARGYAEESAKANRTGARSGNEAAADGNGDESARDAYSRMMGSYGGTLMDCGLDRLGVGYGYYENKPFLCGLVTPCVEESRWVATFAYR